MQAPPGEGRKGNVRPEQRGQPDEILRGLPGKEEAEGIGDNLKEKIMDEYNEAMSMLIKMVSMIADNDEFFTQSAKIIRKMVDALQKAGFTRSEAISIAAHYQGASAK